jgi:hypothetical protein
MTGWHLSFSPAAAARESWLVLPDNKMQTTSKQWQSS